jgi:hypothetical protein
VTPGLHGAAPRKTRMSTTRRMAGSAIWWNEASGHRAVSAVQRIEKAFRVPWGRRRTGDEVQRIRGFFDNELKVSVVGA